MRDSANRLAEKNRQAGQELDRMLMMRKQKEAETSRVSVCALCTISCRSLCSSNLPTINANVPVPQVEEQIETYYREMQSRINDLEPGKLRAYNDLLSRFDRVDHAMVSVPTNSSLIAGNGTANSACTSSRAASTRSTPRSDGWKRTTGAILTEKNTLNLKKQ